MNGADDRTRLRVTSLTLVILTLFGVLVSRLWFLQVLAGEQFADKAQRNSVRLIGTQAPRGRILDRDGTVIVKNRTALAVGVRRNDLPKDPREARALKRKLGLLLGMTLHQIDERLADRRTSPYRAVVIKEDVPVEVIFTIRERGVAEFPGVETLTLPVREYPLGSIAPHLLGYVGEVNERELKKNPDRFRLGDLIGRAGIERVYDEFLRGRNGLEKLEIHASGRVLRKLGEIAVEPGNDLKLSLDADVQRVAESALAQGVQKARGKTFAETGQRFKAPGGAAVVLDARTGEVIAMASYPTFDITRFVGGVPQSYYSTLFDPLKPSTCTGRGTKRVCKQPPPTCLETHCPLINRAMQAAYPPGSTFKAFVSAAALATDSATPGGRYACTTDYRYGDVTFRNWRSGSGALSLSQALAESCDTVFYRFGSKWWTAERAIEKRKRVPYEVMPDWARKFGFDSETGIDLPNEEDGLIPDRAFVRERYKRNCRDGKPIDPANIAARDYCPLQGLWVPGYSINMSIGQGDVQTTPLQMASAYAAIANGGTLFEPRVGMTVVTPDGKVVKRVKGAVRGKIDAPRAAISYLQRALQRVSTDGTARFPYRNWPLDRLPMAAKTGSAEFGSRQPLSWFASYGPTVKGKQYVVVTVVEQAGHGAEVAGPVVRRIMDELYDQPPLPIVYGARSD